MSPKQGPVFTMENFLFNSNLTKPFREGLGRALSREEVLSLVSQDEFNAAIVAAAGGVDGFIAKTAGGLLDYHSWGMMFPLPVWPRPEVTKDPFDEPINLKDANSPDPFMGVLGFSLGEKAILAAIAELRKALKV